MIPTCGEKPWMAEVLVETVPPSDALGTHMF